MYSVKERGGVKDRFKLFGPSNMKDGIAMSWEGENYGEVCLGESRLLADLPTNISTDS